MTLLGKIGLRYPNPAVVSYTRHLEIRYVTLEARIARQALTKQAK